MLDGWIELRCPRRPGLLLICETWFDVREELRQRPPMMFVALERVRNCGESVPATRCYRLMAAISGEIYSLEVPFRARKTPRPQRE